MKENLKLFWQNMTNNKYWIPLVLFAVIATVATREDILGEFENS